MVDLVGIGVSGLAAYQRALATTGNNIANLQTAGYVRQRVNLQPAGQDNSVRISLGAGVRFAGVERLYDRYLEENIQRSGSDLQGQVALLSKLQQLQDALGSSSAGLHGALQAFFDSARALEASPGSTGARAGFLASAEGVAGSFRSLSATTQDLDNSSRQSIEQAVSDINVRLREIASLNSQLIKRSSDADQPMQLLDRRDVLLKEVAERIGVTAQPGPSGAVALYAGGSASGAALVEGATVHLLSASFDTVDPGRVQLVLDAASQPSVLPTPQSGTLGGLMAFRGQALGPAQDKLDELALRFGTQLNRLNSNGLDAVGQPGKAMFYVGPRFTVEGAANAGTGRLDIKVRDPGQVRFADYQARFDGRSGNWTVTNQVSGDSVRGTGNLSLDGIDFNFEGQPQPGDSFHVVPDSRPAASFALLLKEPADIAAASPLTATSTLSNISSATASVERLGQAAVPAERAIQDVITRSSAPDFSATLFSATRGPIARIAAGTAQVALHAEGPSGQLAVFTRDGRQLSGPSFSAAAAQSLLSTANGFRPGATLSTAYRDKAGAPGSYLDQTFSYGVVAHPLDPAFSDPGLASRNASYAGAPIAAAAVPALPANALRINGVAVPTALPAGTPVAAIAQALDAARAQTGVAVSAVTEVKLPLPASVPAGSTQTLVINGSLFSAADVPTLLQQVRAAALANPSGPLGNLQVQVEDSAIRLVDSAGADLTVSGSLGGLAVGKPGAVGAQLVFRALSPDTDLTVDWDSSAAPGVDAASALRSLGLNAGFNMARPLDEDLLVFGVDAAGQPQQVSVAGDYTAPSSGTPTPGPVRPYQILFGGDNSYQIVDVGTNTVVAQRQFDATTREIRYADWQVRLSGIPANGDSYTVDATQDPLGDNRNVGLMTAIQQQRSADHGNLTLQDDYESLVNRMGALSVQAEVSRNAQQVVYDHATAARDSVSGVNLDEELADLLRFQQAYQANAQVIQAASKLFDSLIQRL